jgi:hypothetical protein
MADTDHAALHGFVARILGWSPGRADAVEHAMRSLRLAGEHRTALVLLGETDMVPIAYALHRRTIGVDAPFVVGDPRRFDTDATVRSPANYASAVAGFTAATGGTLCLHCRRLPRDFPSMVAMARTIHASVQLMICADARFDAHPFLVLPAPIRVPSLLTRTEELPRIVDEYARDAVEELRSREERRPGVAFTVADRQWVLDNSPRTLGEIEKATRRIAAIRMSSSLPRAAERLGMAPVSLTRWIGRRTLPPADRAEIDRDLEASFVDDEAGKLIDADDVLADLKSPAE